MADPPTPITLVFSPDFGTPHLHPDGVIRYYTDKELVGRMIAFRPIIPGVPPRTMFEIGRHPDCWLRIDRKPWLNEQGYSVLNTFSRKHATFQWMDVEAYPWVGRSRWFIICGGVFVSRDGIKESSTAKNGVWLNGVRLRDDGNPEPLFPAGAHEACISLGVYGRIVAVNGLMEENSTAWDPSKWEGELWPPFEVCNDDTGSIHKRLQLEGEVLAAQKAQSVPPPAPASSPWFVPSILTPGWAWFVGRSTLFQVFIMIVTAALVALWIVHL